jgi:hypothetical protein
MGDWNLYNSALEVHFSINIFSGASPKSREISDKMINNKFHTLGTFPKSN